MPSAAFKQVILLAYLHLANNTTAAIARLSGPESEIADEEMEELFESLPDNLVYRIGYGIRPYANCLDDLARLPCDCLRPSYSLIRCPSCRACELAKWIHLGCPEIQYRMPPSRLDDRPFWERLVDDGKDYRACI